MARAGLSVPGLYHHYPSKQALLISPAMWRQYFRPLYQEHFEFAHRLGLHVWFHSCGNISAIVPDFHEIGVDVMNISQPNVVDIESVGEQLRGKQCFMAPVSYQTTSILGRPEEIRSEARRLARQLGCNRGGFIGYVEQYSSVGMPEVNYRACVEAFRESLV